MHDTKPMSDSALLRAEIESIADQLCELVDGSTDFCIDIDSDDKTIQKLAMLVNFMLSISQRALKDAEDREIQIRTIMDAASEGMITIDVHGIVQSFNKAATGMFGYDGEEVIGQNVKMLMPPSDSAQHEVYIANYLRTGVTKVVGKRHEVMGQRKDGTQFPMELAVSEVMVNDQHLFSAIIRDLTEQNQLQCELAQAHKLESVGQLAAGIAHEINTPTQYVGDNTRFLQDAFEDINGVLERCQSLVEAVKDGTVNPQLIAETETAFQNADVAYLQEEIPQAIEQSLDGVGRVAKIVRAMKEFSHPGKEEKSLVDLHEAIGMTITVARNEWKYVAEMVTEFDSDLPQVLCLPAELNQVFLNLIVNAAHAIGDALDGDTTQKGTITISTRHNDQWVEILLSDTGTGIPEKIRSRIFDPFFTTKDVGKGTGQGLAIARSVVVDKHDGEIDCESKPGEGTTFIVRLPIDARQQNEATEAQEHANPVC